MSTAEITAPRYRTVPECVSSRGQECVELAASAGLILDQSQVDVLDAWLGVNEQGKWAAFEIALNEPRQNGKGAVLEARELAGIFLWGERFLIHSAHQFDTSLEAFRRLLFWIEETPDLSRMVKKVMRSHGEEGIEFITGQRIRFRTRTRGGGRGFSCDFLALDEAMFLPEFAHGALLPTMAARPDPQVAYTGSAVDEEVHEHGVVWARVRERGIAGDDPSLAYVEYSVPLDHPREVSDEVAEDPRAWQEANPGLGIRISERHIAAEQRSMDARTFAVERLGVGAYPRTDGVSDRMIEIDDWDRLLDKTSKLLNPVCIAYEVNPERKASITAAGRRPDGLFHVEVIASGVRASQLPKMLATLETEHDPLAIVANGYGPTASVRATVEEMEVRLIEVSANDHAKACGLMLDLVNDRNLRHLGSDELRRAIRGAGSRPLAEAWVWSHKNSNVDISPLVSATLALWAVIERPDDGSDPMIF